MTSEAASPAPRLAAPGAGLPWLELQVARLGFGLLSRGATREKSARLLAKERSAILALAKSCDPEKGARQILIRRLPGLEDSSRYWSVFMTLEHLRLVHFAIAGAIQSLGKGEKPARQASTADVKPAPGAGVEALRHFDNSCDLIERAVSKVENLQTPVRFAHPWFGPLNAAQWYYLSGFHAGLHRQQIKAIMRQL